MSCTVFMQLGISFGVLLTGINCINLGLISPIEVVEEWGCHDTEIRLTCGHLDSKLAILEATFTPNCTQENCLELDVKRLARILSTPKYIDPRVAEAEAGRKFLETLRKTHTENDEEVDEIEDFEGDSNTQRDAENDRAPKADRLVGHKGKRTSLKASLERMIVRYLRKLSPNDDVDFHVKRSARFRRNASMATAPDRVVIGERNITLNESDARRSAANGKRYRTVPESRSFCGEQKRKVSSLDRFDIEHSYQNESDHEYNIRKILNRRCSGRNHCSFLFAMDHPYSKLWDNGVVRVKYICMDDFRVNRYCNEHLAIDYEVTPDIQIAIEPTKGEPVAQARVQPHDQGYHSLKILTVSDDADDSPDVPNSASRKRKIKLQKQKIEENRKDSGIYSQDFKLLKILPSDLDDFNDIEQIRDEIYFRTNDKILDQPQPTASSRFHLSTKSTLFSSNQDDMKFPHSKPTSKYNERMQERPVNADSGERFIDPRQKTHNSSKFENITLIIREGEQYIITFPNPRILDNISVNASQTTPHPTLSSTSVNISTPEDSFAASATTETSFKTITLAELDGEDEFFTHGFGILEGSHDAVPTEDHLSAEASNNDYNSVGSDGENRFMELPDSFYDDTETEEDSSKTTYTSIQRTLYGRPLLHGFAMSPGYPKFYIGEYNCKWVISAPLKQKIRVTILDLSLRYDCKDYVEIFDLEIGRSLFNSCSESPRPQGIISNSNQIEVIMRSTTKFAYPKRGVLLHYSALGCVNPPEPRNGFLVNRTETLAFYECSQSYVFPDSGVNKRKLVCTDRHTWDRILPDCVEQLAISGSGLVASYNLSSRKQASIATTSSAKMSNKDADLVYDVIIPAVLITGLFVLNAIVFVIILRYRRRNKSLETENVELAEL